MLSGDNSILNRASEAKNLTGEKSTAEAVQLAYIGALTKGNGIVTEETLRDELDKSFSSYTLDYANNKVIIDGKEYGFDGTVGGTEVTQQVAELPTGIGTKPYLPSSSYKQLPGTDLTTGLVMTDASNPADTSNPGNEYVWIEVPSTYVDSGTTGGPNYSSVTSAEDYTNIEEALIAYSGFAKTGSDRKTTRYGCKDEWYDGTGHTYDGTKWYDYNGTENTSYSGNQNDKTGCGLTYTEYTTLKQKMLKSIYTNGGFWIGRYEAGTETARSSSSESITNLKPLSKVNSYPINYVTCSQAADLATRIDNIGTYNSSLMFGVQWDLVIKHLENKGVSSSELKEDSSTWGNYNDKEFILNRGKYNVLDKEEWELTEWKDYTEETEDYVEANYKKIKNKDEAGTAQGMTLTTTGASDTNSRKNIYDLAGNVGEWILEHHTSYSNYPCASRGGVFDDTGSDSPASERNHLLSTSNSVYDGRFQIVTLLVIELNPDSDELK